MARTVSTCIALVSLSFVCIAMTPVAASASNQGRAGINLGGTSFLDGFGRPVEGFTYQAYLTYSTASAIYNAQGNEITAFHDPHIATLVLLNQLSYYLPETLFSEAVRPAINFVLPVVMFDTSFGTPGPVLHDNGIGVGDLTFGPMFQFKPIMAGGQTVFSHRLEIDLIVPIGQYDPGKNLNQGSNYVSINPHWAATVIPLAGLELSIRMHYIYNMTNDRPTNAPMGAMVESAQAGQAIWLNFATSYEFISGLHVGANGYYLKQLTADKYRLVDGTQLDADRLGEGKAQVLGIGPGALWEPGKGDKLFANVYFQTLVESRAGSTVFNLRWLHSF